jgi:hypothetical protein
VTFDQFSKIFGPLAVQLRATDADETTVRAYHRSLQDLEPEFVAMAAERLARTADWFPKTSEWRETADTIERERRDQQQAILRKLVDPLCADCRDTGWAPLRDGVTPCDCRTLRRLEVLGRRPMPALPDGAKERDGLDPRMVSAAKQLALTKGMS